MAGYSTDKDRKVIPRWRTFAKTLKSKELSSVTETNAPTQIVSNVLGPKIKEWLENRSVGHAADVVGTALTLGRAGQVSDVAQFLLSRDIGVSPWVNELAERVVGKAKEKQILPREDADDQQTLHERVRLLRWLLREESRDPITWVELSRVYAILGKGVRAGRSMTVALQLAKNNRFVLRAASRFWIYRGDPERAHDILVRADRTRYDPWLLAAEIAIGSIDERKPKFVKLARSMLAERRFLPIHTSELASALATLELNSGRVGKSKRLFKMSLHQPTENSIAQVAWASRRYDVITLKEEYLARPDTFEARSWAFYTKGRWKDVVEQCHLWRRYQPFSARPGMLGSYVAAVALEDYATAERFCREGLIANPTDFSLLNNLAFSLINRGELAKAKQFISRIPRGQLSRRNKVVLQATKGLWEFRAGNVKAGRDLYLDALVIARRIGDSRLQSLASVFYVIEECSRNTGNIRAISDAIVRRAKQERDPIFRVLEGRLARKILPCQEKRTR